MSPQETYISVVEPISPAIERVKDVLFRPFDLGRWFVIGFSAWLAYLTDGGGGSGKGPRVERRFSEFPGSPREILKDSGEYIADNPWVVPVAIIAFLLIVGIGLLLTWLSSRGKFMFLYCVAQNKAEVRNPWHMFRQHGNSLFAFRIVLDIFGLLAFAAFAVPAFFLWNVHQATHGLSIVGLVALVISALAIALLLLIIHVFTTDFVAPIMYLHGVSCRQGWARLLDLLAGNKGRFILYLLFQIVIGIAMVALVVGLSCITFGCACCLSALPYIGTVIFLPFIAFDRAYSLCYLAQYGPQYNAFPPEELETPQGPEPEPTM